MAPRASALLLPLLLACSAEYHVGRGREALDAHDLAEAETRFRVALDREPDLPAALAGLGWTYSVAGQRPAARDAFQRCVNKAPQEVACLRGLASVSSADGDAAAAQTLLDQAAAIDPDDAGVQASLALLEMSSGKLEAAQKRYETLITRFPQAAEHYAGLAEVQLRQDQAEAALATIDKGLADPDAPARYRTLLFALRARALVAATGSRVDPANCSTTAPPVLAWLDAADKAVADAEATGVPLPDLPGIKRLVARRRGAVEDLCPSGVAGP